MYVIFGTDADGKELNDVWQYDPSTVAWTQKTAAAPCGGRAALAVAVAGGVVWVIGGRNAQGDLQDVWTYNPGLNNWAQQPNLPYALSGHSAVNYNGVLYVYGGDHLLQSTPVGWSEMFPASMPPARAHHIAVVYWENGVMRVFGGQDPNGVELSDVWEYRFASNTWGYLGEMPIPLTQSAAALLYASTGQSASQLKSSRMVMFGGLSGGALTDRTFYYMPANTGVEWNVGGPKGFALSQNYPNPFNPETSIEYSVREACQVLLSVYDMQGREVAKLVNSFQQPGVYKVNFNAGDLATGVYFYRIRMMDFVAVSKMVALQ